MSIPHAEAPHQYYTIKSLLEPSNAILLPHSVRETDTRLLGPSPGHTPSRSTHHHVEIHTKNTDTWVVPSTKIDVFLDTEPKVSGLRKVSLPEFILLDFETTLKDFLGLGATDGNVNGDLFVTADTECSDCVSSLGSDGCLAGELFQHLRSSG